MVLKSINANILDVVPSKGKINNNELTFIAILEFTSSPRSCFSKDTKSWFPLKF